MIILENPNKNNVTCFHHSSFFNFLNVMVLTVQNSMCVRVVTHVEKNTNPGGRGALFLYPMHSL